MNDHKLFLRWWLLITLVVLGAIFALLFDIPSKVYENDATKLSFLIVGIFTVMSVRCGIQTYTKEAYYRSDSEFAKQKIKQLDTAIEAGWFASDLCLTIGMIGTVIGFIMMLAGFGAVDAKDASSIQNLMSNMSSGMATALYTTLTGLICSALLKIQCFNIDSTSVPEK
jgi:lysylphosphatidylglycerol synthetase-like protein (DUF2156 family)